MSYTVNMHAEKIDCRIPLSDMPFLIKEFQDVVFSHGQDFSQIYATLTLTWEEDSEPISGVVVDDNIVLRPKQSGSFKNSSDGGLEMLLEKYDGSGIVKTTGEEGDDTEVAKYEKGKKKVGKVVFT